MDSQCTRKQIRDIVPSILQHLPMRCGPYSNTAKYTLRIQCPPCPGSIFHNKLPSPTRTSISPFIHSCGLANFRRMALPSILSRVVPISSCSRPRTLGLAFCASFGRSVNRRGKGLLEYASNACLVRILAVYGMACIPWGFASKVFFQHWPSEITLNLVHSPLHSCHYSLQMHVWSCALHSLCGGTTPLECVVHAFV
jgi:hypothetical protein